MKNRNSVLVKFANPKYNYATSVSATTTKESASAYFVNAQFDMGVFPVEDLQVCVNIEFTDNNYTTLDFALLFALEVPKTGVYVDKYKDIQVWVSPVSGATTYKLNVKYKNYRISVDSGLTLTELPPEIVKCLTVIERFIDL